MKIRTLIIVIGTIFSINGLFAQVSTDQAANKNIYTIQGKPLKFKKYDAIQKKIFD